MDWVLRLVMTVRANPFEILRGGWNGKKNKNMLGGPRKNKNVYGGLQNFHLTPLRILNGIALIAACCTRQAQTNKRTDVNKYIISLASWLIKMIAPY